MMVNFFYIFYVNLYGWPLKLQYYIYSVTILKASSLNY